MIILLQPTEVQSVKELPLRQKLVTNNRVIVSLSNFLLKFRDIKDKRSYLEIA